MSNKLADGDEFFVIQEPEHPLGKALWAFMRANGSTGPEALSLAYAISLMGDADRERLQRQDSLVIQEKFRQVLRLPGIAQLHDVMEDVKAVITADERGAEAKPGHNSGFTAPLC